MTKIAKILYFPYRILLLFPVIILSTIFCGLGSLILIGFNKPRLAEKYMGYLWGRINIYCTPVFVKVYGKEYRDRKNSYIICANHMSQYDIFILYGWLFMDFIWVLKQSLRKVPIIGIVTDKIGSIFVDRSDSKSSIESINRAKEKIKGGNSVIFFPEGTRSSDGTLLPFKKGAFNMALDLSLPILPVTIIGTDKVMPAKSLAIMPGSAKMIIHKPVSVAGYSKENINDLIEKVRGIIQSGIDKFK